MPATDPSSTDGADNEMAGDREQPKAGEHAPPNHVAPTPKRRRMFTDGPPTDVEQHVVKHSPVANVDPKAGENARTRIHALFEKYRVLDKCAISGSDPSTLVASFEALTHVSGECTAVHRLAARLVPRFLPLFPQSVDPAAMALMAVYTAKRSSISDPPAIVDAIKADALAGLSVVVDVAYKLVDKAVPTVLRIAEFQMKLVQAHVQQSGERAAIALRGTAQPEPSQARAAPEPTLLRRLIRNTFQLFPRVVISICLQALKGQDKAGQGAAVWLLKNELLSTPGAADAGADTSGAAQAVPSGSSNGNHSVEAPPAAMCLAQQVLADLPDTQHWLRQAIQTVSRDKKVQMSREIAPLLQELSKLAAPASPAPPPPPPPPPAPPSPVKPPEAPQPPEAFGNNRAPTPRTLADGVVLQPPLPPGGVETLASPPPMPPPPHALAHAPPSMLTPLAIKGGPITMADCCLHMAALPAALTPASLKTECEKYGAVDSVHLGPQVQLPLGEAWVVFQSVRDAAMCAESIANQAPWGGSRTVRCEFCPGLPLDCPARARDGINRPATHYVWCAALAPPEALVAVIRERGLPSPTTLLRVAGSMPGFLLDMPDPECCQPVVELLLARFMPPGTQPPPILYPPGMLQQAHNMRMQAHSPFAGALTRPPGPPPHLTGGAPPPPPGGQQQQQQQGGLQPGPAKQQPVHPNLRTLWVGQVHGDITDDVLLGAFKRFGGLASWHVVRASHCAFIDFMTHASAAEAQKAMNGAKICGHSIRVEWKQEPNQQSPLVPGARVMSMPLPSGHTPHGPFPGPWPGPPGGLQRNHSVMSPPYQQPPPPDFLLNRNPSMQHPDAMGPPPHMQQHGGPHMQQPGPQHMPASWQGLLAKSGVPQCQLTCLPPEPAASRGAQEPHGWPASLDVRMRVELQYVVTTVWPQAPPHLRAARRLMAAPTEADENRLVEFVRYLSEKGRAGVIKLEAPGPWGPSRTLYLAPPSPSVAQALGLTWDARRDAAALLAVVVPTPQNTR